MGKNNKDHECHTRGPNWINIAYSKYRQQISNRFLHKWTFDILNLNWNISSLQHNIAYLKHNRCMLNSTKIARICAFDIRMENNIFFPYTHKDVFHFSLELFHFSPSKRLSWPILVLNQIHQYGPDGHPYQVSWISIIVLGQNLNVFLADATKFTLVHHDLGPFTAAAQIAYPNKFATFPTKFTLVHHDFGPFNNKKDFLLHCR